MIWRKSAPTASETTAVRRVLVIHLGGLVPFLHALAAAKAIRAAHVGARITLLTTEPMKALAEKCPYFDTVEADGRPKEPQAITALIARIRSAKYDVVYDLEGSSRTNNYFQGLRPWPPKWSGPVGGASFSYIDPERAQRHPLDYYAAQLRAAGIDPGKPLMPDLAWLRPALRDPPRLQPDFFGIRGRYVLLLPRGAADMPARRWTAGKYAEVARTLASHGVTPVVLGGPEERDVGAAVLKAEPRAKNLVGRADLFQNVALAERAYYAFGDDVDLMHVAAAASASCLVFLSTMGNAELQAPRGPAGVVIFTAEVVADLSVEQVERQLRNAGVYQRVATA